MARSQLRQLRGRVSRGGRHDDLRPENCQTGPMARPGDAATPADGPRPRADGLLALANIGVAASAAAASSSRPASMASRSAASGRVRIRALGHDADGAPDSTPSFSSAIRLLASATRSPWRTRMRGRRSPWRSRTRAVAGRACRPWGPAITTSKPLREVVRAAATAPAAAAGSGGSARQPRDDGLRGPWCGPDARPRPARRARRSGW